jgi:hypothetical protein
MTQTWFMLAQEEVQVSDVLSAWTSMSPETKDRLIMLGVFTVLILALIVWAAFFRKQKRKHHHKHHRPPGWQEPAGEKPQPQHRHRRRRRSDKLPKNPTLAEAGGLPPVRSHQHELHEPPA